MTSLHDIDTFARWNALHAIPRFSPRYPSESVIRWTFRNFPRESADDFNLLDVGAGAGRHAVLWAREGYQSTALDVSALAISGAINWAQQEGLAMAAAVSSASALPFEDESFDGVLSFGVLYYLPYAQMKQAISDIWRILKTGGKAFILMKSDADSRCLGGERVDQYSYRVGPAENGAGWASEVGMTLTLLDRNALEACFTDFAKVTVDRSTVTTCNGRFVDDEWLIELEK